MFTTIAPLKVTKTVKKRPAPTGQTPQPAKKSSSLAATQRKANAPAALPRQQTNGVKKQSASPRSKEKRSSPALVNLQKDGKRKPASPRTPLYQALSSDDEGDDEIDFNNNKRQKREEPGADHERDIWELSGLNEKGRELPIIHGENLTKDDGANYTVAFPGEERRDMVVELQYPSHSSRERFELVALRDNNKPAGKGQEKQEYDPLEDLVQSIETICIHYFPPEKSEELLDDEKGFPRRFKRELNKRDRTLQGFMDTLDEFNALVNTSLESTIPSHLQKKHIVPLDLTQRILDQTFSRTVSPQVHLLKDYKNGTDNVYGELMPRFVDRIIKETGLKSHHVFADLGSGVGNVVLQVALQAGCESWGIEMMDNPAKLARKQHIEFRSRCRRWGVKPGKTKLIHGSFLDDGSEINDVLKRADVLLINNFAFQPKTNDNLKMKFLDLKEGCKIVHLKPFKAFNKIELRNIEDVGHQLQHERKFEFFSDYVSWGAGNGDWYISIKDTEPLKKAREQFARRGGRAEN